MSVAFLLHGGTVARRAALAQALRDAIDRDARVRLSSRAAEAAKCLADPAIVAVFLIDGPHDADTVRAAAGARGLAAHVYDLEPHDAADVMISLARAASRPT